MIDEYFQCRKCETVGRSYLIFTQFDGKCPACGANDWRHLSKQEADALWRDVICRQRLTDEEWRSKWCDVCGAPAEIRLLDTEGKEVGFRCLEHYPATDDPIISKLMEDRKKNGKTS